MGGPYLGLASFYSTELKYDLPAHKFCWPFICPGVKKKRGGVFKVKWGVKLLFKGQVKILVTKNNYGKDEAICLYHAHAGYTFMLLLDLRNLIL